MKVIKKEENGIYLSGSGICGEYMVTSKIVFDSSTLHPGQAGGVGPGHPEGYEVFYVSKGEVLMCNIQADEFYEFHEGDITLVYEGEPHELTNIGTDMAVITRSCAPKTDRLPYRQSTLDLTGGCIFTQGWTVDNMDKGQPLHQMIHSALYHKIVSELPKPGNHLLECFLAEDMKVNKTPVRKAIIRLEKEGLVRRKRGCAIVESIPYQDIEDTPEIHSTLEKLVISNGTYYITQEGIQCMEQANEDFCRTLARGDTLASVGADETFYDIICQLSGSRTPLRPIRDFESTMYRFQVRALNTLIAGSWLRNMRPLSKD